MVSICQDCGQEFLSTSEYKRHQQTHLQTHLDKWSSNSKPDKVSWKPPEGMSQIFEKYRLPPARIPKELEDQEKKKSKTES
ncbi:MAG: hypothetical protein WBZ36_04225 [Candidatus Nitrosopolaris sp.]